MYESLRAYLNERASEAGQIESRRRAELVEIAGYIGDRLARNKHVQLTFICTHNSRRSHLAQVWAAVCAQQVGVRLESFSGGTERTAMYRSAAEAMARAGCRVQCDGVGTNPRYEIRIGESLPPLECFSKRYDERPNPVEGHAAIMVCSDADEACPHIAGADARFALPYIDPKVSDGTPQEAAVYDERCAQIAREMHSMISMVSGEVSR
jgi:arsenate reductase (thioredoxin)